MRKYNPFSPRASLAAVGAYMRQIGVWETVCEHVHIAQKTIKHAPLDKLLDALITILAGGHGVVEVNTRVRPDEGLQRAFGRRACAEQSTVSQTLNACDTQTVGQMRQALCAIYRRQACGYRHAYARRYQVLDVDMTGLPSGPRAEGATKGYFSGRKNRRGRQLGRVLATLYDEIVFEKLYPGTVQLEQGFQELLGAAEEVLALDEARRARTIVRVNGGGGCDEEINWMLSRGYQVVVKVKNWKRAAKLARSVREWYPDPKVAERQLGWDATPHPYARPTQQLAMRWPKGDGQWHYRVLVFTLSDEMLFALLGQPRPEPLTPLRRLAAIVDAYDLRGGGVEATIRGSKQGLGLRQRNKRRFAAQEMLVLLAQLAYNLVAWVRNLLAAQRPAFQHFGTLRMVRDVLHIAGTVQIGVPECIPKIRLNKSHHLAKPLLEALRPFLARDGIQLILHQI